jgi:hypothetical protein
MAVAWGNGHHCCRDNEEKETSVADESQPRVAEHQFGGLFVAGADAGDERGVLGW